MKKTLRFSILSMLLMLCGTAFADEVTISAADMQNPATEATTVNGITFLAEKNNGSTAPTFNANAGDFRIYAKGTLTVSAEQNITKMVFNISTQGKKRLAPITASVGAIAEQAAGDETVTWSGEATGIVLTVGDKANYGSDGDSKAGQFDFESVTITLGEGAVVETKAAKPVITPNGGSFADQQEVTITAAAGAKIFYALNDAAFGEYTAPFVLTETTTVKAYAYDETKDVKQSETVEATFTKQSVVTATCQDVINGQDGVVYQVKGKCTNILNTTYGNWDLEDETGTIRIYGTLDAEGNTKNFASLGIEVGDIVTVQGPRKDYNGTIELTDVTVISIEKGSGPVPEIEEISVGKALQIIDGLADGAKTEKEYDVTGYIVNIKEISPKVGDEGYGNATYEINDEAGVLEDALTVYRGYYLNNEYFTAEDQIAIGDKVVVRGKLQRYVKNGEMTPEVAQGNYIVEKGTATAISHLNAEAESGIIYNLQGQLVMQATKGLYIIGGKKLLKK